MHAHIVLAVHSFSIGFSVIVNACDTFGLVNRRAVSQKLIILYDHELRLKALSPYISYCCKHLIQFEVLNKQS